MSAATAARSARTSGGDSTSTFAPKLSSVRAGPYAQLAAWLGRHP